MAKEFGIPEKEVATNWRNAVRSAWGDSIFKKHIYDTRSYLVTNTNPRSMKRYPKVRKVKCAICGDEFGKADTELDHIDSEVKMTEVSQANDFIRTIFFVDVNHIQPPRLLHAQHLLGADCLGSIQVFQPHLFHRT